MEENQQQEERKPIGVEAKCWSCSKIWNISTLPAMAKDVKCTCGGHVITPSGKVMSRPFYDIFDSTAPLLEENTYADTVGKKITGEDTPKGKIIIPGVND